MKMGVKEFRERFREVALGDEPVVVTHHGRVLGRFVPARAHAPGEPDIGKWADARRKFAEKWRAETPDWAERLASYGLDEDGEPIADEPRR